MSIGDGLMLQEKYVDRAYQSGMIGFWSRWSRKKNIQRRLSPKKEKNDENA